MMIKKYENSVFLNWLLAVLKLIFGSFVALTLALAGKGFVNYGTFSLVFIFTVCFISSVYMIKSLDFFKTFFSKRSYFAPFFWSLLLCSFINCVVFYYDKY